MNPMKKEILYDYVIKEIAPILDRIDFTEETHGGVYKEISEEYDKLLASGTDDEIGG